MTQLSPIQKAMYDLRVRSKEQQRADEERARAFEKACTELIERLERLADNATRDWATSIERTSSTAIEFGTAKARPPGLRITTDRSKPPCVQVTVDLVEEAAKLELVAYDLVVVTPQDPEGTLHATITQQADGWFVKNHWTEESGPLTAESVAEAILSGEVP